MEFRTTLRIDVETFSSEELKKTGVHRYVEADDFAVIMFQYAYDDGPVIVLDLLGDGDAIPQQVLADLVDPTVRKTAWNAAFERVTLSAWLGVELPPEQWFCSMVHSMELGMPGSLADAGAVLKLDASRAKMNTGRGLITTFCKPCKPTKKNGRRTRNLPHHEPEKWALFKEYGARDVEAERTISLKCDKYPLSEFEHRLWCIDQRINDRGVLVDRLLIDKAIELDALYKARLRAEAVEITGLSNPNSVKQLLKWINDTPEMEDEDEIAKLTKETVPELIKKMHGTVVQRVLELRQGMAKTSVSKYITMRRAVCRDGRVRGMLQFYGANRTGRWAGRLIQVHNLPSNKLPTIRDRTTKVVLFDDLNLARDLVRAGRFDDLELLFGSPPHVLSELIRTAFIPESGTFTVVDFSAIEARVLAWLAQEEWRLEVFATHGMLYEASASKMFNVPWSEFQTYIDRGAKHPLRKNGKVGELALGYQGGEGALVKMGALKEGLKLEDLDPIKVKWRLASPRIAGLSYKGEAPGLWERAGNAMFEAVRTGQLQVLRVGENSRVDFFVESGMLHVRLPSGRCLRYLRPRIEEDKRGFGLVVTYEGVDPDTKRWGRVSTYGGKLVENLCQAIARDCLAEALMACWYEGIVNIVLHVHDELVEDGLHKHELESILGRSISWAKGLLLKGDAEQFPYYRKGE